jgi:AAA15 family ATPase/GTPase
MTIKDLQLPLSDYKFGKIGQFYTKEEVDQLIVYAVNEAKRIDEESMRKHNKEATMISMALGFTTLALFVDGLLRLLGIVPPFMDINISIIDEIMNKLSL